MAIVRYANGQLGGIPITAGINEAQKRYALLVALADGAPGTPGGAALTVQQYAVLKDAQFVVSTAGAYAANNVLSDVLEIPNFFPSNGAAMFLDSFNILDVDDLTVFDIRVWIMGGNYSLGSLRAAPSISDADAANIQNYFEIAQADAIDIGGSKVYKGRFEKFIVRAAGDSRSLWMQLQIGNNGTPTFSTTSAIKAKVGGFV